MRFIFGLAFFVSNCLLISHAAASGADNRHNRGRAELQVVTHSKKQPKKLPVKQSTISSAIYYESDPEVYMPDLFLAQPSKQKKQPNEVVKKQTLPQVKAKPVATSVKRPGLYSNDPEKLGVDPVDFSNKLSRRSHELYNGMDEVGKKLALRLSTSGENADNAVSDAFHEMKRRQQTVNRRKR